MEKWVTITWPLRFFSIDLNDERERNKKERERKKEARERKKEKKNYKS